MRNKKQPDSIEPGCLDWFASGDAYQRWDLLGGIGATALSLDVLALDLAFLDEFAKSIVSFA